MLVQQRYKDDLTCQSSGNSTDDTGTANNVDVNTDSHDVLSIQSPHLGGQTLQLR
jgi:hypothetical protein